MNKVFAFKVKKINHTNKESDSGSYNKHLADMANFKLTMTHPCHMDLKKNSTLIFGRALK